MAAISKKLLHWQKRKSTSGKTLNQLDVFLWISVTLMVRSPEADTIYLSSKSTTFTAALCPTRTRRRLMSVGEAMSQTAMERSLEQVTIRPFAKRRWRTASLWWISVFSTSPVVTSQTLQKRRVTEDGGDGGEEREEQNIKREDRRWARGKSVRMRYEGRKWKE